MTPMTGVTNAQDEASRIAVREAVAARMAQAGSSSAMSGEKTAGSFSHEVIKRKHLCCSRWIGLCTPIA